MKTGVVALALCIFAAQDFKELKTGFKKAVRDKNDSEIARLAGDLAASKEPDAMDLLIWGYDQLARRIETIWRERAGWQTKVEAGEDVLKDQGYWYDEVEKRNGMLGGQVLKDYNAWKKKKDAWYRLKAKVTSFDRKINEINAVKGAIVGALAEVDAENVVDRLIEDLKKGKVWTTRAAVAEALGRIGSTKATGALIGILEKGDKEAGVTVAAIDALRQRNAWDDKLVDRMAAQLQSGFWQVQYAAAKALEASGSLRAIEPLIRAFSGADGRIKHDLLDVLVKLTGVDKGINPDNWQAWFEKNRKEIAAGKLPQVQGRGEPGKDATVIKFFGIPVKSKNVLFVIDRSLSMERPSKFNEEELHYIGTGGSEHANSKLKGLKPAGDRRIDIARYQLKKVILMLPDGTKFNIVFYNHQFEVMSKKMKTLDDRSRDEAFKFIDDLQPHGGTDIWQALTEAMPFCAGQGSDGALKEGGADTIYLLSDGAPHPPGKVVGPADILTRFKDWNKSRKIVIHTIFVSLEDAEDYKEGNDLMDKLAGENGGMFKGPKDTIWKKDVAGEKKD